MTKEEWATLVRQFKEDLGKITTIEELSLLWNKNLVLGHRTLGRIFIGGDIDKMIANRKEGDE